MSSRREVVSLIRRCLSENASQEHLDTAKDFLPSYDPDSVVEAFIEILENRCTPSAGGNGVAVVAAPSVAAAATGTPQQQQQQLIRRSTTGGLVRRSTNNSNNTAASTVTATQSSSGASPITDSATGSAAPVVVAADSAPLQPREITQLTKLLLGVVRDQQEDIRVSLTKMLLVLIADRNTSTVYVRFNAASLCGSLFLAKFIEGDPHEVLYQLFSRMDGGVAIPDQCRAISVILRTACPDVTRPSSSDNNNHSAEGSRIAEKYPYMQKLHDLILQSDVMKQHEDALLSRIPAESRERLEELRRSSSSQQHQAGSAASPVAPTATTSSTSATQHQPEGQQAPPPPPPTSSTIFRKEPPVAAEQQHVPSARFSPSTSQQQKLLLGSKGDPVKSVLSDLEILRIRPHDSSSSSASSQLRPPQVIGEAAGGEDDSRPSIPVARPSTGVSNASFPPVAPPPPPPPYAMTGFVSPSAVPSFHAPPQAAAAAAASGSESKTVSIGGAASAIALPPPPPPPPPYPTTAATLNTSSSGAVASSTGSAANTSCGAMTSNTASMSTSQLLQPAPPLALVGDGTTPSGVLLDQHISHKMILSQSQRDEVKLRTVYVNKLDPRITEGQLRDFLDRCGQVLRVRLCGELIGRTKYGFVEYRTTDEAARLVARDREFLGNSAVRCSLAKQPIQDVDPQMDAIVDPKRGMTRACLFGFVTRAKLPPAPAATAPAAAAQSPQPPQQQASSSTSNIDEAA